MEKEDSPSAVVAQHLAPVRRFASFLARSDFDPDDLVSEAMLAGVQRSCSGRAPDRWTTWFNGVVRNLVRRRIRERKRRRFGMKIDCGYVEDPLGDLQREELITLIKNAITRLPEGPRVVFELALKGCSRPEIARRLDLKLPAVQARWFRGIRVLRIELSGCGIDSGDRGTGKRNGVIVRGDN